LSWVGGPEGFIGSKDGEEDGDEGAAMVSGGSLLLAKETHAKMFGTRSKIMLTGGKSAATERSGRAADAPFRVAGEL
jgi:hypothetical protein